ncbi:hypothetical protein SCA6_017343, partial [Theobroma cacao]
SRICYTWNRQLGLGFHTQTLVRITCGMIHRQLKIT